MFELKKVAKNCIYCKKELAEQSVIDVCKSCGIQVWGEKMYDSIVDNMENAREDGNLHQGSVTETSYSETTQTQDQPQVEQLLSEIDHLTPEIEILPMGANTEDIP